MISARTKAALQHAKERQYRAYAGHGGKGMGISAVCARSWLPRVGKT